MPLLTFTVLDDGSEPTLTIEGIQGDACGPIHNAISADLKRYLGIGELKHSDTSEMHEHPPTYGTSQTVRAR